MTTPPNGRMVWWRFKGGLAYRFGYVTREPGGLVRMGCWNGDSTGGTVVDPAEIEWRERD